VGVSVLTHVQPILSVPHAHCGAEVAALELAVEEDLLSSIISLAGLIAFLAYKL
jgi:hypothetical protein